MTGSFGVSKGVLVDSEVVCGVLASAVISDAVSIGSAVAAVVGSGSEVGIAVQVGATTDADVDREVAVTISVTSTRAAVGSDLELPQAARRSERRRRNAKRIYSICFLSSIWDGDSNNAEREPMKSSTPDQT